MPPHLQRRRGAAREGVRALRVARGRLRGLVRHGAEAVGGGVGSGVLLQRDREPCDCVPVAV